MTGLRFSSRHSSRLSSTVFITSRTRTSPCICDREVSPVRRLVLVVEDDRPLRQLYRFELELRGFSVETAGDGLEALELIEQRPTPDVVVLDLGLPRLGGLSVAAELHAHDETRNIPIVIVTGSADFVDRRGVASVLRKPVGPDELASIVEQILAAGGHPHPALRN
jgi:CheY-like chemotaxis protein